MLERIARSPLLLALLMLVAAIIGGGVVALAQHLSPAQQGVETAIRGYLLEHPEILPEAMQRLQDREIGKAIAANTRILEPFPGAVAGNPKGDVTMAVFMDYACGYCRASLPNIERLIAENPNLRIVYRELPILSPQSRTAAAWALAAAKQGKYKVFHDALFAGGQPSDASIAAAAQKAGLDRAKAEADAKAQDVAVEIATNLDAAGKLGMTGTPSWVVGTKVLSGAQGYDELAAAVRAAKKS